MKDWDCIDCLNGRLGRPSDEAMPLMTLGELDAGKPPVQFDEGRSRELKLTTAVGSIHLS